MEKTILEQMANLHERCIKENLTILVMINEGDDIHLAVHGKKNNIVCNLLDCCDNDPRVKILISETFINLKI